MGNLHPAAQVVALIVIGVVISVGILSLFTSFFDKH
jgi:hypothetical protein